MHGIQHNLSRRQREQKNRGREKREEGNTQVSQSLNASFLSFTESKNRSHARNTTEKGRKWLKQTFASSKKEEEGHLILKQYLHDPICPSHCLSA